MKSYLLSAALVSASLIPAVLARGPGIGARIVWHPHGCSSNEGTIQLSNPADTATSPPCISDELLFNGSVSPAGGWEIQSMPDAVSFELRHSNRDSEICGTELIAQLANDGCYDFPNLADKTWYDFCETGRTCGEPMDSRRRAVEVKPQGILLKDEAGEYMWAATGERIPVYRQNGLTKVPRPLRTRIAKRQSDTYDPPQSCEDNVLPCQSLADSGRLIATCVNCESGVGDGVRASADVDCSNGGTCSVSVMSSVTVTDTISESISFGVTFSSTGSFSGSVPLSFGLSESFSVATTKGQTLGLGVPTGHKGFLQYQPPAVLGTVVASQSGGPFCDGDQTNNVCGASPGILATTADDANGSYSIVLES